MVRWKLCSLAIFLSNDSTACQFSLCLFEMLSEGQNFHRTPIQRCTRKPEKNGLSFRYLPYVNIGFPNGPIFRYGNFFIPRVEKSSQISPRAKNLVLPRAVGPREARFFSQGLIFEDFSTRGMKKFSYLKTTAHSEIVFLYELTKRFCAPIWRVFKKIAH